MDGRRSEIDASFSNNTLHLVHTSKNNQKMEWVGGFTPLATSPYFIIELTKYYENGELIGDGHVVGHLPVKIEEGTVTLIGAPKVGQCTSECETLLTSHGFQRQDPFTGAMYTPEWAFPGAVTKPQLMAFYNALAEWSINGRGNWQIYVMTHAGG